ncbi:MAG: hypothetical protein ABH873_02245 [Candidatus Firestonebacteria bacterium]
MTDSNKVLVEGKDKKPDNPGHSNEMLEMPYYELHGGITPDKFIDVSKEE